MTGKITESFENYTASKTVLFWSCATCVVLTMVVGFTWGGWVTGGTAKEQIATATEDARAQLAAAICVHRFVAAPDASAKLAALKEESSWKRESLIEEGGWVTFASMKEPVDGAADLCADELAEMELQAAKATEASEPVSTTGTDASSVAN